IPYQEAKVELVNMLEGISMGSERIKNIVKELKNFSLMDTDSKFTQVDLNEVVKASTIILSNLIKKSTDNFVVNYCENIAKVYGNFQQIEQVVINLVTNACHALEAKDKEVNVSIMNDINNNGVI